MLDNKTIDAIDRLLATHLSQRKIALKVGVSNTTVSRVQNAKRKKLTEISKFNKPEGPVKRCPVCGGLTRLPCTYCQIVHSLKNFNRSAPARPAPTSTECRIELTGEHRRRYEQIRAWRSAQPNPHFIDIPENWPWRTTEMTQETPS